MPQRADEGPGDQPDALCCGGDRAQQDDRARPRRRGVLVAGQRVVPGVGWPAFSVGRWPEHDVLADHDPVESGLLGFDREGDQLGDVGGRPQGVVLGQDEQQPRGHSGVLPVACRVRPA